ncbi:DUF488 family protein [Oxalobacter sp. OttesenSCG-928-P03]|nr:DUF488 family protein [Oxalobacter sp. OttesenSCG-928-P03]
MQIRIKRAYEPVSAEDGFRVLVDRLWPRGISKEKAHIDFWDKNIAPSTELRKWFNHDPEKFPEFTRRYQAELDTEVSALDGLCEKLKGQKTVSLIYGAKNPEINHARVLQAVLEKRLAS